MSKEKFDKMKRRNTSLDELRQAAEKEMFQFSLNEKSYTVEQLEKLGMAPLIPNLIRLNKRTNGVKILNQGNMPVLVMKLKTDGPSDVD